MKIDNIKIEEIIANVKKLVAEDKEITPALKAAIEMLILVVTIFVGRLSLNSKNSSKPPSQDPNRTRAERKASDKKPGGQIGRLGKALELVSNPDEVITIPLRRSELKDGSYKAAGYEVRQVFDIRISRYVTEYRAEKLADQSGKIYTASFPDGVFARTQYGNGIKAHSVYMSQFQLIPYDRIKNHFEEQISIPVSVGSVFNFNKEAYHRLEQFEELSKLKLKESSVLHADETGINIGGKRLWLHNASNDLWTHFYPHKNRGSEAMDEIGILPGFRGVACHDHWSSYYIYKNCLHSLCNAHHLRELQAVIDIDKHQWAKKMQDLLCEIKHLVDESGGKLEKKVADEYRIKYRKILSDGELESPLPPAQLNKNGTIRKNSKKTKDRNLLERLRDFEDDTLRFMEDALVPFTNNQGENDLRMTKVQQKISGCFRSMEGAKIFCRIRGYILTCQKHGVSITEAFKLLFEGNLPDFCNHLPNPGE